MAIIKIVVLKWLNAEKTQWSIVNESLSINDENLPNPAGLPADNEVFIPDHTNEVIVADPIYFNSILQKGPTNEYDSVYTQNKKFAYTYTTEARTEAEIFESIDNAERIANEELLPACDVKKCMAIMANISSKQAQGLNLTEAEEATKNGWEWVYKGITMNASRNLELKANYLQSPTLDGWITALTQIPGYES